MNTVIKQWFDITLERVDLVLIRYIALKANLTRKQSDAMTLSHIVLDHGS